MVTDVINLGSGSKGNAYFLNIKRKLDYGFTGDDSGESFGLLIECGLPFATLSQRLREQSHGKYSMVDVHAVLVTHRHYDHSLAVKELLGIGKVVYAPISVFEYHDIDVEKTEYKGYAIPVNELVKKYIAPKITITPFPLEHDEKKNMLYSNKQLVTKESDFDVSDAIVVYGYIISIGIDYNVLFFIDTMFMPFNLRNLGLKFNVVMGEANHFHQPTYMAYQNALENKNYANIKRYERIIFSHMSVETFVKTINGIDLSKCEKIFVMHTSSSERVTGDEIKYYNYIKNNIKPYHHKDLKILVCKEQGNYATGGL
jgi:phosphoribosyl 1,2-cyclic phosphodiesterase